jgi:hypothetical protein
VISIADTASVISIAEIASVTANTGAVIFIADRL